MNASISAPPELGNFTFCTPPRSSARISESFVLVMGRKLSRSSLKISPGTSGRDTSATGAPSGASVYAPASMWPATGRVRPRPSTPMRATSRSPASSNRNQMLLPSAAKRGLPTLRSSAVVSTRGVPPATGTTARCAVAYHSRSGSAFITYAICLPSGLQAGSASGPGLVVTWRKARPRVVSSAATTQMSSLRLASGSAVRLETNAIHMPSGLQVASPSSKFPEVIWVSAPLASVNT